MPPTRRRVLLGSATLPLLPGCTRLGEPAFEIVELEVVLVNGQDEPLTFRFALETTDGTGEWSSYEVEPHDRRTVTVAPPEDRSVVGIRASVAGHDVTAELLEGESGEACPRIFVEYELAETPTILQSTDVTC